jgi:pimeloyl-ACP methyl ester carboxylesterase
MTAVGAGITITSTDGVHIAAHDLGGTGPPILMTHATGLHGRVWRPVARELADRYHCLALDLRGHGDADSPTDLDYDWSGFADDVLSAVDQLALDRPFGVGHSKGGAALLLAEQRRPGTFAALWCFDPVVFPPTFSLGDGAGRRNDLADGAARRRSTFDSFDEAVERYRSKPPFDVAHDDALAAYVRFGFDEQPDGTLVVKCPPEVEAQVYRMAPSHDAFAHLDRVRCPVTVARGRLEPGPAMFAAEIVEGLANGQLVDYPHLSHFGPLEAPGEIAAGIDVAFGWT